MPNLCAMKDCKSNGRTDKLRSFYRFPLDPERCKAWVEASGRPELEDQTIGYLYRNLHVCDLHFKPSDRNRKKLKLCAIPFPYNQLPKETKSTQTDIAFNPAFSDSDTDIDKVPGTSNATNQLNSRKGKGERKKRQLIKLGEKLRNLREDKLGFSNDLLKLVEVQTELCKLSKHKECADKLQLFALSLYIACPMTYRSIKYSLTLPTEGALRRCNLDIDAVMSSSVIVNLKSKMSSFKAIDKCCTVCLKKMSLKRFLFYHINTDKVIGFRNINGDESLEPTTEVYVLLARGLNIKWEQPIAYCFLGENDQSSNIDPWINLVIGTLIGIGYDVVALVVDHEDLYDHFRNRIQSFAQPHIKYTQCFSIISTRKVYCIFDLPQLIISLRNTLMSHKLQFQDDDGSLIVADWETIEALYYDNSVDDICVLVPKLTKSHVHPDESEKKELRYAAEVFSKSVSDALGMIGKSRVEYDNRIRGTQKLTALVNDVFDILNSSALNHHNKCKNAFTGEPCQMRVIRQFMDFLTNVKPLNDIDVEDTSFNCIYGLRISIMSLSIILRDLLPMGIRSLVTHRFNLDVINSFFEAVKRKSKNEKPTAIQFYTYFRHAFKTCLMKCPKTVNRADNLYQLLNRIDLRQMTQSKMKSNDFKRTIEVGTTDYRFELPISDSFHYTCWYLLKKCFEFHDNTKCERLNRLLHDKVLSINWKYYNWETYFEPPAIFIDFIKSLDEQFNKNFGYRMDLGLGTGIILVLKDLKFELICPCFPINYLRRLFVRLRIFHIIRYNNRRLRYDCFCFSSTDHYNIDAL